MRVCKNSHGHRERSCPSSASAAVAILMITASCMQTHAYAPSTLGIIQSRSARQSCYGHTALRPTTLQKNNGHWSSSRRRNTQLYEAVNGDVVDYMTEKDDTTTTTGNNAQQTNGSSSSSYDEAVFDNLLPSTSSMATNSISMSRVVRRPATGLSSSVLLPLSPDEVLQSSSANAPLFQSNPSGGGVVQYNNKSEPNKIILESSTAIETTTSWKERLVDVSNIASFLCVLDCTLLPLVSVAVPALSWGVDALGVGLGATTTASNPIMSSLSSFMSYLPALSHGIALYFVIPVGLLTTLVNYLFGHKEIRYSMFALLGVSLIYVANSSVGVGIPSIDAWLHTVGIATAHAGSGSGHATAAAGHVHDACGAVVGAATNMMAHTCPSGAEGLAHRLTNTLGCAFLLGSNYYSRKYMEEQSRGCAASALAQAWGGGGSEDGTRRRPVCPPGCNCEAPGGGAAGETFFQWERNAPGSVGKERRIGNKPFTRFRR